jgi:hypothetical protein
MKGIVCERTLYKHPAGSGGGGRNGGRKVEREGGKEEGRKGEREEGMKGGREEGMKGGRKTE